MHPRIAAVAASLFLALLPAAAHADGGQKILPPFLFGLGVGGSIVPAEYVGPVVDMELDFGGRGHYFGLLLETGGGRNQDSNGVALTSVALGYRAFLLRGPVKPSFFIGGYAAYEREFEGNSGYDYLLSGVRAAGGVRFFATDRFSVGFEIGTVLGYRQQVSGPYDYSGFSSGLDGRLKFTF
jgi:hypothetical protein